MSGRTTEHFRQEQTQALLSLPPNSAAHFLQIEKRDPALFYACSDPVGQRLGSGGGTAHLLAQAWRDTGGDTPFVEWLRQRPKLMIHAGGQSRRLPAYAAMGKALTPMPVWRWSLGQRLDQTLLDLQLPFLEDMLARSPNTLCAAVASGDALLRSDLPVDEIPDADVVCFGLWTSVVQASRHGVFFCRKSASSDLQFFLQKPAPETIRDLSAEYLYLIDTGFWLFSERAIEVLMAKCGWQANANTFARGVPDHYELYAEFGLGLGVEPRSKDDAVNALSCAVVPLPAGHFHHFGTSRELIDTTAELQNAVLDQRRFVASDAKPHPTMFTQNSVVGVTLQPENHTLWAENSHLPDTWSLASEHVFTGIPRNDWQLSIPKGVCIDMAPLENGGIVVRPYGIDDAFRGRLGDAATTWMGQPAAAWFNARGLTLAECALDPDADIQQSPLFPVIEETTRLAEVLEWMISPNPRNESAPLWQSAPRLSAEQIGDNADLLQLKAQRNAYLKDNLRALAANRGKSVFLRLDLHDTAQKFTNAELSFPGTDAALPDAISVIREAAFKAALARRRKNPQADRLEQESFAALRDAVLHALPPPEDAPECTLHEDQILWCRSPVRLDLAGGWTDTPPHCFVHGGAVVNLATDLNGQPPIQVFIRQSAEPVISLRSIDLGQSAVLATFDDIRSYANVGNAFSIVKAALALTGFIPEFCAVRHPSLKAQLDALGGGLEISFLAAVPKGSGLGTSSILAAAILTAIADACGLGWDRYDVTRRTLALEQLLTTGGGWQDQVGGIFPGIKLAETTSGFEQSPLIRWLPDKLMKENAPRMLLYYTGITRVAKGILQEIVRGMFLNSKPTLDTVEQIRQNAYYADDAIQRGDWDNFCTAVSRSWHLNTQLDPEANPANVQAILDTISEFSSGAKLLGAGGGGYLLILAKDEDAASRIRHTLAAQPPSAQARFVDMNVSEQGCVVTRS